jgi:hypothetical protein
MVWIVFVGVVLFMALFGYQRWKSMAPLFADEHLAEVAAALPDLKRRALAAGSSPGEPPSIRTAYLDVGYSISREGAEWAHHLSVSNRITPARAAGALFLGLLRGVLRLEAYPLTAFVSRRNVFHLVVRLSDDEERTFAALDVASKPREELRTIAVEGRSAILPRLGSAEVPLPAARGRSEAR